MNRLKFLFPLFLLTLLGGNVKAWAEDATVTVSTLSELEAALANNSVQTVIVSGQITLTDGTELDGQGKTVQVASPNLNEDGSLASSPSNHGVFLISSSSKVTIQNMKVMGGQTYSYGAIQNSGILTMTSVTMTRSNRGLYNSGTAVLINCNLVRNAASYGGGLLNSGGSIVMDGCSFTENRASGGGGAAESNGSSKMYLNNTTMSNNICGELGPAINNYHSFLYIMNSAVTGNVGISSYYNAGALRLDGGSYAVNVVNSIITDNKYIGGNGSTVEKSDFTDSSYSGGKLFNCIIGTKGSTTDATNCTVLTDETAETVFADYVDGVGLYTGESSKLYTEPFTRPALIKDGDHYTAPAASDGPAATLAVESYFDWSIAADGTLTVEMYFRDAEGTLHALMSPAATATADEAHLASIQKTTKGGPIGSTDAELVATTYYTVTRGTVTNGTMEGISLYGDSYRKGKSVTVTATPNEGYLFAGWILNDDATATVTANPYTFTLNQDTKLTPVFANVVTDDYGNTYSYDGTTVTMTSANLTDGALTLPATVSGQTSYVIPDDIKSSVTSVTYPAAGYATFNNLLGNDVTYAPTVTLGSSGWATIYSSQDFLLPEGLEAYVVTGSSEEQQTVSIEQVGGIKASTPMLLHMEGGGSVVLTPGTVTLESTPADILKGFASPLTITATATLQPYILVDGVFRKASSGTLAPYLCYLELPAGSAAARKLQIVGNATGISANRADATGQDRWYTLGGQQLNNRSAERRLRPQGLKKGIYIHNGRKEVVK